MRRNHGSSCSRRSCCPAVGPQGAVLGAAGLDLIRVPGRQVVEAPDRSSSTCPLFTEIRTRRCCVALDRVGGGGPSFPQCEPGSPGRWAGHQPRRQPRRARRPNEPMNAIVSLARSVASALATRVASFDRPGSCHEQPQVGALITPASVVPDCKECFE